MLAVELTPPAYPSFNRPATESDNKPEPRNASLLPEVWVKVFEHVAADMETGPGALRSPAMVCRDVCKAGLLCTEAQLGARMFLKDLANRLPPDEPALPTKLAAVLQNPDTKLKLTELRGVAEALGCASSGRKDAIRLNILKRCGSPNQLTMAPPRLAVAAGKEKATKADGLVSGLDVELHALCNSGRLKLQRSLQGLGKQSLYSARVELCAQLPTRGALTKAYNDYVDSRPQDDSLASEGSENEYGSSQERGYYQNYDASQEYDCCIM